MLWIFLWRTRLILLFRASDPWPSRRFAHSAASCDLTDSIDRTSAAFSFPSVCILPLVSAVSLVRHALIWSHWHLGLFACRCSFSRVTSLTDTQEMLICYISNVSSVISSWISSTASFKRCNLNVLSPLQLICYMLMSGKCALASYFKNISLCIKWYEEWDVEHSMFNISIFNLTPIARTI